MVGAVVVREGEVVGEGFHARLGGPHAEVVALAQAGERSRGSTVYVTLEPCSHFGRTPPCADALLEAQVARLVACHGDPNPEVAGAGFERLRGAGVDVEVGGLAEEALRLNLPFILRHSLGRPAVTLKWAMSLDGRIATVAGDSQWISGEQGRRNSLWLREEHDAILVGSTTALADDPRLNRRLGVATGPFHRVVLDRRLRLSPACQMLTLEGPVLVYTEQPSGVRQRDLEAAGAEVIRLGPGEVGPAAVLEDLGRRGIQSLLVEGGGEIHAAFVTAGLYDRVVVDCAPLLVGGDKAPGPMRGPGFPTLEEAPRLESLTAVACGEDILLEGFRSGCLQGLLSKLGS